MADVNGTINVEVLYREAGSPGGGGAASGGGNPDGAEAASEKKKKKAMDDQTKFLKGIFGSLTIGALIKQSKIGSTLLGTLTQLMGALVDVFLMPFVPLLIPVLKFLAKVVTWFAKFMQDPAKMLKEGAIAIGKAVKDAVSKLFSKDAWENMLDKLPTSWDELWEAGSWAVDKALPFLVGAGGLWTMAKIMEHLFGVGGSLLNTIKSSLGLGGDKVTDLLKSGKCCQPGGGVVPGGGAGKGNWLQRFGTRVANWGSTIGLAAIAFKDSIASAGRLFMDKFGQPLLDKLLPFMRSSIGTAVTSTLAAGAAAIASWTVLPKVAADIAGLPEAGPSGQRAMILDDKFDNFRIDKNVQHELRQFHEMLKSQTEWINGQDPQKKAYEFTHALSQFGDRGFVNQMKQGVFGEQGIELAIRLDLQQEDFETRYQNLQTTNIRLTQNTLRQDTAWIIE